MSKYNLQVDEHETSLAHAEENSSLLSKLNASAAGGKKVKKAKTLSAMSKKLKDLGVSTDKLTKEQINKLQLQQGQLDASQYDKEDHWAERITARR